jgi:NADPH:quinone reductase-like Zn-dependent oxidoreductase
MLARLVWPLVLSPFTSHRLRRFISNPKRADLEWLAERVAEGSLRPIIGSMHALAETAAALRVIENGHSRGKVVVTIAAR